MHLKIQNAAVTIAGNTILEEVNFEIKDRDRLLSLVEMVLARRRYSRLLWIIHYFQRALVKKNLPLLL